MSKRQQQRQRGWVEFKGLQHAEPFMTRSELVWAIHAFFAERGLSLASRQTPLPIRFSRKRDPRVIDDGVEMSVAGVHYSERSQRPEVPLVTKEIVVYVRQHFSRDEFVNTLFHELDHAAWVLEGQQFDHSQRYWDRPHEIRARRSGREWEQRLAR